MHLRDLKLRAMNGSVLVEGELGVVSDEPAAAALPTSSGRLIGVDLPERGAGPARFHIYGEVFRREDGFYAAPPPLLTVTLEEGLPDSRGVFTPRAARRRQRLEADGAHLATVSARYPRDDGVQRDIVGRVDDLTMALAIEDEGLRLSFEGPVGPMGFYDEPAPRITRGRLVARLLVPRAYCKIKSLMFPHRADPTIGPWTPWGPGLGAAPMDSYGRPFCPGRLTWTVPPGGRRPPSRHVSLYLHEHRLVARACGDLNLHASGAAWDREYFSDGPELELGMGVAEWTRMLGSGDVAEMEWRGAGIGHVDGQTGRSVGECGGPKRQLISRLGLRLSRSREGLQVTGRGELAPLAEDPSSSLGPELSFDFLIPRGWILATGAKLPGFWLDWRRDFPDPENW